MGFDIECHNEPNGTDVPGEGGGVDNNNTCVMNNGCDVYEQLDRRKYPIWIIGFNAPIMVGCYRPNCIR